MARQGRLKAKTQDIAERPIRRRCYKYYILIACEDEKGEPTYFNVFQDLFESLAPDDTVKVKPIGTGFDPLGVVKRAIQERDAIKSSEGIDVNDVWVVFDKDDDDLDEKKKQNFFDALELAKINSINVAYSNECFELWFLLHFDDVNAETPMPRTVIYKNLQDSINRGRTLETKIKYCHKPQNKDELDSAGIVDIVMKSGDEKSAIKRANVLRKYHIESGHNEIESNPRTEVDNLIDELRKLFSFYSYGK